MDETLLKKAKERVVRSLQFSDKSEYTMRSKLAEDKYDADIIDAAIEWAKSKKYLDDERFTESFIRCHAEHKSKRKLAFDLQEKGVAADLIARAIEDADIDEDAQIKNILEKKKYSKDLDQKEKDKIIASLARKGYSWGAIKKAVDD